MFIKIGRYNINTHMITYIEEQEDRDRVVINFPYAKIWLTFEEYADFLKQLSILENNYAN